MGVFPTPVGMVRESGAGWWRGGGVPHARGDGPIYLVVVLALSAFSPRPWGWS